MDFRSAQSPTLIFGNGLGDHILTLPAVRALAGGFGGRLGVLAKSGMPALFWAGIPFRVVVEEPMVPVGKGRTFDWRRAASALGDVDVLLSLNPWHSVAVERLIDELQPRHSVGFFSAFKTRLPLDFGCHSVDLAFSMPRLFDSMLSPDMFASRVELPAQSRSFAAALRRRLGRGRRLMVIHNETKADKVWDPVSMGSVVGGFLKMRQDYFAVALGRTSCNIEMTGLPGSFVDASGLSVHSAMALVRHADLFLGADSLFLHAADLERIPGVGLFGPTNPLEFGYRFQPAFRHVQGDGDMNGISADHVLQALLDLAKGKRAVLSVDAPRQSVDLSPT